MLENELRQQPHRDSPIAAPTHPLQPAAERAAARHRRNPQKSRNDSASSRSITLGSPLSTA